MSCELEHSKERERWNQFGEKRLNEIRKSPSDFLITHSPYVYFAMHHDLMKALDLLRGKNVLELGCGTGKLSVFLAQQGAKTMGVDVSPNLIEASRLLAQVNGVECGFQVANITELPYEKNSYDIVVGISILHHLSERDVAKALQEAHKVLKDGGKAIFYEPVENSRLFDLVQKIFPVGKKKSGYYRPSILRRKEWAKYKRTLDDRTMTNRELVAAGSIFNAVELKPYGLLIRLQRWLGAGRRKTLGTIDRFLFRVFPPLRYLCQTVLVVYQK